MCRTNNTTRGNDQLRNAAQSLLVGCGLCLAACATGPGPRQVVQTLVEARRFQDCAASLRAAEQLLQVGQRTSASAVLAELLCRCPESTQARAALRLLGQGRELVWSRAMVGCLVAELNRGAPRVARGDFSVALARALMRDGRHAEALALLRRARGARARLTHALLLSVVDPPSGRRFFGRLEPGSMPDRHTKDAWHLAAARFAADEGRSPAALSFYGKIKRSSPWWLRAQEEASWVALAARRTLAAEAHLARLSAVAGDCPSSRLLRALLMARTCGGQQRAAAAGARRLIASSLASLSKKRSVLRQNPMVRRALFSDGRYRRVQRLLELVRGEMRLLAGRGAEPLRRQLARGLRARRALLLIEQDRVFVSVLGRLREELRGLRVIAEELLLELDRQSEGTTLASRRGGCARM